MNYSKPSISRAMKNLKEAGYIVINSKGEIELTENGAKIANRIYERHILLTNYFIKLGVPEEIAKLDACRIEHDLSDETFEAIKKQKVYKKRTKLLSSPFLFILLMHF